MAAEWPKRTVAELQELGALLVEDGNHGENRPRPTEFSDEGVQFIRAADMDGGRVLFESAQRINEVARQRVRKGIGAGGDVILSHKGTVGKVACVPSDAPPFVCSPQTTFWRVKDPKQLDRRFIYYFLLSRAFREQLDSRKGETDMADYVIGANGSGKSNLIEAIGVELAKVSKSTCVIQLYGRVSISTGHEST